MQDELLLGLGQAADDNNLYAYVGNDPLNKSDPTGKCESASTCRDDRDIRDSASGKLSTEQLHENQAARAAGVAVGGIVVATALTAGAAAIADIGVGAELAADANAARVGLQGLAQGTKEVAQSITSEARATIVAAGLEAMSSTEIKMAQKVGVEGAEISAKMAEAGEIQGISRSAIEAVAARWKSVVEVVDKIF